MNKFFHIIYCESPIEPNKVDPDYEEEYLIAKENGFNTLLFNYEILTGINNVENATRLIKPNDTPQKIIYRGWMLTPKQYSILYDNLKSKNYKLINSVKEYQNCHYLPDSLAYIESKTPKTIFQKIENEKNINDLIEKVSLLKQGSLIVKDYVKSEKHDWDTACFVKDSSDTENIKQTIQNLIKLRGDFLNEGIVIREFVELNDLTIHSKSGMPLTEEYRLFFYNKKLIDIYDYWEEGDYIPNKPNTKEFEDIAKNIESNFFSMDIARKKDGEFIIIELGDGQVAGLPDKVNKHEFYLTLKNYLNELS